MSATIVDWAALLKVVWVSLAGGIGVATAYGLVVFGTARAGDERRRERPIPAAGFALLALLGLAACGWALYRGYLFVVEK
ncbi:MAG: hypothetical protein QOK31_691 [Solirubrobacteraceae bacterium]|jgi:hypothetical protein|nr:hypothetical protein [Solirubrobacteraceae bacterium]